MRSILAVVAALVVGVAPAAATVVPEPLTAQIEQAGACAPVTPACRRTIAVDAAGPSGAVFVVDGHRIYRRNRDRSVHPVAGSGAAGRCGDGGPALRACLNPYTVAYDRVARALYVSTYDPPAIRRIDAAGRIATVATDLVAPEALAADRHGGVYVADVGSNSLVPGLVRHLDRRGILRTVAGNRDCSPRRLDPVLPPAGDGGPATTACLFPRAPAVGLDGTLYVADDRSARVRAVDGAGRISTVAGNGFLPADQISMCPGEGPLGCLGNPTHLAVAPDGLVYVAAYTYGGEGQSYYEHAEVYRIEPGVGVVRVTGRPISSPFGRVCLAADHGPALLSCFGAIEGLLVDDAGRVLFTSGATHPFVGELRLTVLTPGQVGAL